MLYCKYMGRMCYYVDDENGDCNTVNGKCIFAEKDDISWEDYDWNIF